LFFNIGTYLKIFSKSIKQPRKNIAAHGCAASLVKMAHRFA